MNKFDSSITVVYVDEPPKDYRPQAGYFVGVVATVHIKNVRFGLSNF